MKIHLEGMGLQGALLAHRLHQYGVQFTWHDIKAQHTAWKASTGAIYPADSTNHGPDRETYEVWRSWYDRGTFEPQWLECSSGLVFCTKRPPHKGNYQFQEIGSCLRLGSQPSFHFNAQTFVKAMRVKFADREFEAVDVEPRIYDRYVITHGWGARFHHAYWGWTRKVQLSYDTKLLGDRPAFYFRPNRYIMAYAYPIPGGPWYYAGSSIIKQSAGKLHELEAHPKYERWKSQFQELGNGLVQVITEGDYLTGWRPAAAQEDEAWVKRKGNILQLRPLWNSGIRHFPRQWQDVATHLGLIP